MKHRFTILPLLLCFLPACPSGSDDAPPPKPTAEASVSLGAGPPGGLGGLPGNGLGGLPGSSGPGAAAPGAPPVPTAPGNAPAPGGPGAAKPASPAGGYGKAQ